MGTIGNLSRHDQDVVLDIERELDHWRACYQLSPFHRHQRPFEAYVPTLKFGYDMYLLNYHKSLDHVLPLLSSRYLRDVPASQRLDWPLAEAVVREAWKRMQPVTRLPPPRRSPAAAVHAF